MNQSWYSQAVTLRTSSLLHMSNRTDLQLAEEPLNSILPHSVDFAPIQCDPCVGLAVGPHHLLEAHQALPGLQQNTQDHEASLHVSLKRTDIGEELHRSVDAHINTD